MNHATMNQTASRDTQPDLSVASKTQQQLDQNIVCLVNFVAPNDLAVFAALSKRVRKLTILSSVAMEGNRDWDAQWGTLDVVVQKTWTITRNEKHPGGYSDTNYIHLPLDTLKQLKQLNPDSIVSMELGLRTALAMRYRDRVNRRRINRHRPAASRCTLITGIYASERSEAGRGRVREKIRRRLIRKTDWMTYNGPSCRRHLLSLGANSDRMSAWDYAADPTKPYRGSLINHEPHFDKRELCLLTIGQLSDRKGIDLALEQLSSWCQQHPQQRVAWNLVGSGPLQTQLESASTPDNLQLVLHGHQGPEQLQQHYRDSDVMLFPTRSDEWGLVVDESLHSGLPVIGSIHAQACPTVIENGINGWTFDPCQDTPEAQDSLASVLTKVSKLSADEFNTIRNATRPSVQSRTPETSADQIIAAMLASKAPNVTE